MKFVGDTVRFECHSDMKPVWVYEKEQRMPPNVTIHYEDNSVIIDNLELYHDGFYYCYGYERYNDRNFVDYSVLIVKGQHEYCLAKYIALNFSPVAIVSTGYCLRHYSRRAQTM